MGSEDKQNHSNSSYKLPIGPNSIGEKVKQLSGEANQLSIDQVRGHVRDYLVRIAKHEDPRYHDNLKEAVWIAEQCHRILDNFDRLNLEQQQIAMSGIRYFIVPIDSIEDHIAVNGFNDDKQVIMHILEQLQMLPANF